MDRFIRGGIIAAITGGLLLALGAFLPLLPPDYERFSDEVVTGLYGVSSALRFTGTILTGWGLVAIHLRQANRAGRFGLVAVIACLANLALQEGWMFSDLFVAPAFAGSAPEILNGDTPGRLAAGFLAAWIANTALVLLGIATLRARVLPKACGIALIVAGGVTLLPLPVDGPAFEVIIGIAIAAAAASAIKDPAPVALVPQHTS